MMKFVKTIYDIQLPLKKIRGFATNVANYQPVGTMCPFQPDQGFRNGYCLHGSRHKSHPCCDDPCRLEAKYSPGNNELNYAQDLLKAIGSVFGVEAHVIIDTGRNGVGGNRESCQNWCNPRGAGAGIPSSVPEHNGDIVDAFFWLKTPGESDGCSQTLPNGAQCPRFDMGCASVDSLGTGADEPPAPEAGLWFDYQVKQLAENAVFEQQAPDEYIPDSSPSPSPNVVVTTPPAPAASACAKAWGQCGGDAWNGPTCCQEGCTCAAQGGWYSQCLPPDGLASCTLKEVPDLVIIERKDEIRAGGAGTSQSLHNVLAGGSLWVAAVFVAGAVALLSAAARRRALPRFIARGGLRRGAYETLEEPMHSEVTDADGLAP